MAEYTYEDIIMDPEDPRLEGAIGKECYFSDYPKDLLRKAKNGSSEEIYCLKRIIEKNYSPFIDDDCEDGWTLIIIKKEEPKPRFIPFSNKIEFIVKFNSCTTRDDLTPYKYVLLKYGMWLEEKATGSYYMVTELFGDGVVIGDRKMETTNEGDDGYVTINKATSWEELLRDYCFIDGSPCGKEVEE